MTVQSGRGEGTVFDLGYRRYEGPREGRSRARMAVYMDGLKTSLGIGRGGRAKILPWVFIGAALIPALIMAIIAGTADRFGGAGTAENLDLPSHSDYYNIAALILYLFAATAGPELLCPDRRNGVINLYLVRPITGSDYVWARYAAFLTVMLAVAWLPQVVLFAGLAFGAPQPPDYLKDHWEDVPKFLASGAGIAFFTTSMAMVVASFTTRRAYAAVFLIGLLIVSSIVAGALSEALSGAIAEWVALLNLVALPLHFNDWLFNSTSDSFNGSPVLDLPRAVRVGSLFVVIAATSLAMWLKYRRMSV